MLTSSSRAGVWSGGTMMVEVEYWSWVEMVEPVLVWHVQVAFSRLSLGTTSSIFRVRLTGWAGK